MRIEKMITRMAVCEGKISKVGDNDHFPPYGATDADAIVMMNTLITVNFGTFDEQDIYRGESRHKYERIRLWRTDFRRFRHKYSVTGNEVASHCTRVVA